MSAQPRGRACQSCHSIKIKCELGTRGGNPPCERCVRLGKDCQVIAPKRQKDKVAELEAKVAALTRLLESQGIREGIHDDESTRAPSSSGSEAMTSQVRTQGEVQKKRKLDAQSSDSSAGASPDFSNYAKSSDGMVSKPEIRDDKLSRLPSLALQQRVLDRYTSDLARMYPAVPLSRDVRASDLGRTHPILLHAILFAAGSGIVSEDAQEEIAMSFIAVIASNVLTDGKKSLELLQALQIAVLWYSSPKQHNHIATLFQFLHIATNMGLELGYGGSPDPAPISASPGLVDVESLEAKRAWLVSYILTASSMFHRRRPSDQRWTAHHDHCLQLVENATIGCSSGRLLGQLVRGEAMFVTIMEKLNLAEQLPTPPVGEPLSRFITIEVETLVRDWRAQVPGDLYHPNIDSYGYVADILIYEPILHTATNKASFAAPYLPHRISVTDFAAPVLNRDHVQYLQQLKYACHQAIECMLKVPITDFMSLPGFLFVPRLAYAVFILTKMHVAVTAPGNTFGQVLTAEDVMLEPYLLKSASIGNVIRSIDSRAAATRVLEGANMTIDWLKHYNTTGQGSELGFDFANMTNNFGKGFPEVQTGNGPAGYDFGAASMNNNPALTVMSAIPTATVDPSWDNWFDFGAEGTDFQLSDFFQTTDLDPWNGNDGYVGTG